MSKVKPIETKYNGYKFRSRLEARWAVFFDEIHTEYNYETEGFSLYYHGKYLPDFHLPKYNCFFEIKPSFTVDAARQGLANTLKKPIELSIMKNCFVYVVMGDPLDYTTVEIRSPGGVTVFHWDNIFLVFQKHITINPSNLYQVASTKAREARFEFGETPETNGKTNGKTNESNDVSLTEQMLENFSAANYCPSLIRPKNISFLKELQVSFEIYDSLTDKQFQWLSKYYIMAQKRGELPEITSEKSIR